MDTAPIRHERVGANGLRFHVAVCGEGDSLALCLHGCPESWYSWRHQLPLLARLGWRAWAPDLRGYGGTDKPTRRRDYAIEILLEDVAALIDAAGARRVMLLSHDWGGIIGWYFAIQRVRPLVRFVAMNIPHPGAAADNAGFRQLLHSWYVFLFQIPRLPEWLLTRNGAQGVADGFLRSCRDPARFTEDVLQHYRENALQPGAAKAMLDYYRAFVIGGGAIRLRNASRTGMDTSSLLLWGEEDIALTKALTFGTERYVENLTLRYLPGVSHWVQQEAPRAVNAMLEAWLEDRPVPEMHEL